MTGRWGDGDSQRKQAPNKTLIMRGAGLLVGCAERQRQRHDSCQRGSQWYLRLGHQYHHGHAQLQSGTGWKSICPWLRNHTKWHAYRSAPCRIDAVQRHAGDTRSMSRKLGRSIIWGTCGGDCARASNRAAVAAAPPRAGCRQVFRIIFRRHACVSPERRLTCRATYEDRRLRWDFLASPAATEALDPHRPRSTINHAGTRRAPVRSASLVERRGFELPVLFCAPYIQGRLVTREISTRSFQKTAQRSFLRQPSIGTAVPKMS